MSHNLSAFAYLLASVCFIMALRGLSSPVTARAGNLYGVAGMVIAVATTLASPGVLSYWLILLGVLIGGSIGTVVALRIQMTALPQLVAAFHSLVGLAAVFVAAAAFYQPDAYGIGTFGQIPAGFTYFGQFVDHDLTFDKTTVSFGSNVSAADLIQGRSPALDMDSLYDKGPANPGSAKFYKDDRHFKLGKTEAVPGIPAKQGFDLQRDGKAVIPDKRNDENLAVAQTHLALQRFPGNFTLGAAGAFRNPRESLVELGVEPDGQGRHRCPRKVCKTLSHMPVRPAPS